MASRRNRWASRAAMAIVVALVGHALVIAGFIAFAPLFALPPLPASTAVASSSGRAANQAEEDRPMEIETIVNQLDRPEDKTEEEKKREEEQKKEEEDKNPHGQVVDIAKPTIEQRPDNAKYVSEYDSKVDRETRGAQGRDSAGARSEFSPPEGNPDVKQPQQAVPGSQAPQPVGRPGKPGPLAMRDLPRHKPTPQHDGEAPRPTENGDLERAGSPGPQSPPQQVAPQQPGEGGSGAARPSPAGRAAEQPGLPGQRKPNLAVSPDVLQKAIGRGSGSMDYLKDVDDGELTALNSKKWKHAPFFNRVKRSVANEWHPEVQFVRHDPSGNVYGVKDRVTVLRVHLNPDGKLGAWTVLQSCGVDFLDDEAIDAFRKAAPFPNPPKDLVEADGQIHFNFAFIFELSGRGSVKVFKYQ